MTPHSARKIDLGYSHFHELREQDLLFIDKSMLIHRVMTCSHRAALIPRPRRFGKTLNLSMLKDFFAISPQDMTPYFEDLQIWQVPEARAHFQKHPVISVTFKDCKARTWEGLWVRIRTVLINLLREHREIRSVPGVLTPDQEAIFDDGLLGRLVPEEYAECLLFLSNALASLHGSPVILLVDEYDTPIHNALEHGYYDEAVTFFKGFLGAGFKDNKHLYRGVITGILRVSKENMFSDLNNVGVFTLLDEAFKSDFGFTEAEVQSILEEQGCPELMPSLKEMYNGYLFGCSAPVEIYNPWSTLSCIVNANHALSAYWHKSGSPELLHRQVLIHAPYIHKDLRTLMEGGTLTKRVSENINFRQLGQDVDELFGFMLFAGYLKAVKAEQELIRWKVELKLVNRELQAIFDELYQAWFQQTLGTEGTAALVRAVLEGDVLTFQGQLEQLLLRYTSFMDGAARTPEHFYQGLLLGLLVLLRESHTVQSNLEVGLGRADLQLIPHVPGRSGVVMELKIVRGKSTPVSLQEGVALALKQLQEKRYSTLLESQNVAPIHRYGLAFNGKDVRVAELSQQREVEAALEQLKAAEAAEAAEAVASQKRVGQKRPRPARTGGAGANKPGAARAGSAAMMLPPGPSLTLEERLALDEKVLPQLTVELVQVLWLRLRFDLKELASGGILLLWEQLFARCEASGSLASLASLLVHFFPALRDEPLVQKLRG